jgi:hypothetical protein
LSDKYSPLHRTCADQHQGHHLYVFQKLYAPPLALQLIISQSHKSLPASGHILNLALVSHVATYLSFAPSSVASSAWALATPPQHPHMAMARSLCPTLYPESQSPAPAIVQTGSKGWTRLEMMWTLKASGRAAVKWS